MLLRRPGQRFNRSRVGGLRRITVNEFAWLGDSLVEGAISTNNRGLRRPAYEYAVAQGYGYNAIGTRTAGDWPDPQHDGLPGSKIASRTTLLLERYGPGKSFGYVKGGLLWGMANDVLAVGYNEATVVSQWVTCCNTWKALFPGIPLIAANVIPMDPGTEPTAAARIDPLNTAIAAAVPAGITHVDLNGLAFPIGFDPLLYGPDGVHLNDDGFAACWAVLEPIFDPVLAATVTAWVAA